MQRGWSIGSDSFVAFDQAAGLIEQFADALALRRWREAAGGSRGSGVEQGMGNFSLRKYSVQL